MPLIHDASLEKKSSLVTDWSDGTAKLFLGLLRSGAKVHEPKLEKEPPGRGVHKADPNTWETGGGRPRPWAHAPGRLACACGLLCPLLRLQFSFQRPRLTFNRGERFWEMEDGM